MMKFIEVKVKEITPDTESEGCFRLVLKDVEGGLELPMIISMLDARPLIGEQEGGHNIRPQTHDLLTAFAEAAGYTLQRMSIHDFHRGVFYASLLFSTPGGEESLKLDCRPTDGVALALRTGIGMFVSEEVMSRVGILLSNDMSKMKATQYLRVMEEKLQRLVVEERYEEAGILRDRINILKAENS